MKEKFKAWAQQIRDKELSEPQARARDEMLAYIGRLEKECERLEAELAISKGREEAKQLVINQLEKLYALRGERLKNLLDGKTLVTDCGECERLRVDAEWRPIETAPKEPQYNCSATVILLSLPLIGALKDGQPRRVYEGMWSHTQQTWTSVNGFVLLSVATHWKPLPAPAQLIPRSSRHERI